jgi:hypothetical protein
MAIVAARGPKLVGGQKLRRKAEAGYAFFDPRGRAVLISMVVFAALVAFADYAG